MNKQQRNYLHSNLHLIKHNFHILILDYDLCWVSIGIMYFHKIVKKIENHYNILTFTGLIFEQIEFWF